MERKQKELDKIKQAILDKNTCKDLAESATQLVFGDGNPDADIVFIGEAPGKNEDIQGKPFVGAAGKFLDEMLASINLERKDVYITNIVKYRPPNNRDPLPNEKEDFLPYLQTQIEVIHPKLVVLLGRHSMNCFLPDLQISKVHGRAFRKKLRFISVGDSGSTHTSRVSGAGEARTESYKKYDEGALDTATKQPAVKLAGIAGEASKQSELVCVFLPLYHPAAALYNGDMRKVLLDDFSKIPSILKKIES